MDKEQLDAEISAYLLGKKKGFPAASAELWAFYFHLFPDEAHTPKEEDKATKQNTAPGGPGKGESVEE